MHLIPVKLYGRAVITLPNVRPATASTFDEALTIVFGTAADIVFSKVNIISKVYTICYSCLFYYVQLSIYALIKAYGLGFEQAFTIGYGHQVCSNYRAEGYGIESPQGEQVA